MAHTLRATGASLHFGDRLRALRDDVVAAFSRRHQFRRTLNELQGLNDRELADIGLSRCDILRVSRECSGYRG